uniref:Uncharacterized protein n=1 Tax=Papilio xuthus TaxID=66420 RepID=I4DKL3_PAPXU|nr:unknown secreted protein [Papilio xuthus]
MIGNIRVYGLVFLVLLVYSLMLVQAGVLPGSEYVRCPTSTIRVKIGFGSYCRKNTTSDDS